ncbi:hypothetical protein BTUL_0125g00190 [Botrytis tulipae]|uniref:Uncharacterized protein n=1 Tax=Botrytis tulipae TaxID=87230 RepID=A0A4Z1EEM4_9HELO|nr:hypothetical protein BTUL_0125g00190 [Botrytis tulipae]
MYEIKTASLLAFAQDPYATGACAGLYQQTSSSIESLASVVFGSALPIATLNSTSASVPIGPATGWGSGPSSTLNGSTIAGLTVVRQCTSGFKCYSFYHCLSA